MRELRLGSTKTSRWPAILRWLDAFSLEALERMALRRPAWQRFLLETHGNALRKLIPLLPAIRSVTIIGGGMYPRTAILLKQLLPAMQTRIVDSKLEHLEMAKAYLDGSVQMEQVHYGPHTPMDSDLLIIPLSFNGSREKVYQDPPTKAVLVHDWIWRRRGRSVIVSVLLLKRMNLILQ